MGSASPAAHAGSRSPSPQGGRESGNPGGARALLAPRLPAWGCHPALPSRRRLAGPGQRAGPLHPGWPSSWPGAPERRRGQPRCQAGCGLEPGGRPSSPQPPRAASALLLAVPAPTDRWTPAGQPGSGSGWGWEAGGSSHVPVSRCPPPTAVSRRCQDTLTRLPLRIGSRYHVPDDRES